VEFISFETVGDAFAEILRRFAYFLEFGFDILVLKATAKGLGGIGGTVTEFPGLFLELGVVEDFAYGLTKGAEHLAKAFGRAFFILILLWCHISLLYREQSSRLFLYTAMYQQVEYTSIIYPQTIYKTIWLSGLSSFCYEMPVKIQEGNVYPSCITADTVSFSVMIKTA